MNKIDNLLFSEYKKEFLKNPDKYLSTENLLKEIGKYTHHTDLEEYVITEMCRGFFKLKLEIILKQSGFTFCNFIDEKKFQEYCINWDMSQDNNVKAMFMDKKVMAAVFKQVNKVLLNTRIVLTSSFPEQQLWTDKIDFVDSLDYDDEYEFLDFCDDADSDTLHYVSKYIDFIIIK